MTVSKWERGDRLKPDPFNQDLLDAFGRTTADLTDISHLLATRGRIATLAHLLAGAV